MFVRAWLPYDEQTPNGDGLGPMYNAASCADCHHQGGLGGGGHLEHNVELLILVPPRAGDSLDRQRFAEGIRKIHPGLVRGPRTVSPTITLHKFANHPAYDKWRIVLLMLVDNLPAENVPGRIAFELAERNTPSLFGAGLIDSIPDDVIKQVARRQAATDSLIKGQVALATDGGVGKFGWRGQTSSLKQFVMGACANELGLRVETSDQALDPLDPEHKSPGVDLDQRQCETLIAYVGDLPAPAEQRPTTKVGQEHWTAGSRLFSRLGCAVCHVPKLGQVAGIFSDLLLHDMGPDLSDRASANFPGMSNELPLIVNRYYGGPQSIFTPPPPLAMRQWRTPPLWGVSESAPYLHDGRAATLDDAISLHSGEALAAKRKYVALGGDSRDKLLTYLQSLGQPTP